MEEKFYLWCISFMRGVTEVELQKDSRIRYARSAEEPIFITPSDDDWKTFIDTCKKWKIDEWKEDYSPGNVFDNGAWKMDIALEGFFYKGRGDGDYPPNIGHFCVAVEKLLGGLEYIGFKEEDGG